MGLFIAFFSYVLKPPVQKGVSRTKVHPRRGLRRSRDPSLKALNRATVPSTSQPTDSNLELSTAPIAKTESVNSVIDDVPTVV